MSRKKIKVRSSDTQEWAIQKQALLELSDVVWTLSQSSFSVEEKAVAYKRLKELGASARGLNFSDMLERYGYLENAGGENE